LGRRQGKDEVEIWAQIDLPFGVALRRPTRQGCRFPDIIHDNPQTRRLTLWGKADGSSAAIAL
jgi:hypothetical protein